MSGEAIGVGQKLFNMSLLGKRNYEYVQKLLN